MEKGPRPEEALGFLFGSAMFWCRLKGFNHRGNEG